ncbi:MAG TPA: hypothetical protein DEF07_03080 [Nitrosomonas sp.]|nr:hypothetical protein [Nitrosomonas sp.]
MDEQTETTLLTIDGDDIQFNVVTEAIRSMGATIHSIDEVEVVSSQADA